MVLDPVSRDQCLARAVPRKPRIVFVTGPARLGTPPTSHTTGSAWRCSSWHWHWHWHATRACMHPYHHHYCTRMPCLASSACHATVAHAHKHHLHARIVMSVCVPSWGSTVASARKKKDARFVLVLVVLGKHRATGPARIAARIRKTFLPPAISRLLSQCRVHAPADSCCRDRRFC